MTVDGATDHILTSLMEILYLFDSVENESFVPTDRMGWHSERAEGDANGPSSGR